MRRDLLLSSLVRGEQRPGELHFEPRKRYHCDFSLSGLTCDHNIYPGMSFLFPVTSGNKVVNTAQYLFYVTFNKTLLSFAAIQS